MSDAATPGRDVRPHNLPSRLTSFVGRVREIGEVRSLLGAHRLLTLIGAPDVGKTRLGVQVAAAALDEMADGVWLVQLATLADPTLVSKSIASTLGIREQARRPVLVTLTEALREKHMLLVLDNCEHLIDAAAEAVETLLHSCPHLRILATSREPLAVEGEVRWRVPSLTFPGPAASTGEGVTAASLMESEAVHLLADRAQSVDPTFVLSAENAAAVARICTLLDGIPLAVELAAARVRALTAEEIASRLDGQFRLLTGGNRTTLPRHRTLAGAVSWSYELLAGEEQALLRRLSVFAGGCTLEAAEAVCDPAAWGNAPTAAELAGSSVLDVLSELIDKSLVQVDRDADGSTRYRLLEMVRQFGQARLDGAGETARSRQIHRDYFQRFVELAGPQLWSPNAYRWLHRLERDHDNLRAALTLSAEEANDGHELKPFLSMTAWLARFWLLHGHWTEGQRWVGLAHQAPDARLSPELAHLRASAVAGASDIWRAIGDLHEAIRLMDEAIAYWREVDTRESLAWALGRQAHYYVFLGDYDRAEALGREGLAIGRTVPGHRAKMAPLISLSDAAFCRGEFQLALERVEENLARHRHLADSNAQAAMLLYAGIAARELGDYDRAASWIEESIEARRAIGENHGTTVQLRDLGLVELRRGDVHRAAALFGEALQKSVELGARWSIYECFYELASVAASWGFARTAAQLFGAAEALRASLGTALRPSQQERYERQMPLAQAKLGEAGYAAAVQEGRSMPLKIAVELAQSIAAQPPGPAPVSRVEPRGGLLTPREREVAACVARGRTNRQIAAELTLSQRTVDAHIRNMLGKLELSSRAQLAAWSVEKGLGASH